MFEPVGVRAHTRTRAQVRSDGTFHVGVSGSPKPLHPVESSRASTEIVVWLELGLASCAAPIRAFIPTGVHRELIITLAARHRLPAVYALRFYVASGGLVSYGP